MSGLIINREWTRMIANDEARMSDDEGMTKIRMPNLRNLRMIASVISASSEVQKTQSGAVAALRKGAWLPRSFYAPKRFARNPFDLCHPWFLSRNSCPFVCIRG